MGKQRIISIDLPKGAFDVNVSEGRNNIEIIYRIADDSNEKHTIRELTTGGRRYGVIQFLE